MLVNASALFAVLLRPGSGTLDGFEMPVPVTFGDVARSVVLDRIFPLYFADCVV